MQNIENGENYTSREIKFQLEILKNKYIEEAEIQDTTESQLFSLQRKIKNLNNSINILEYLKKYKLEYKKDTILNIINLALKDIFQDDISINIEQEISKAGAIKYNILFYQSNHLIAKNEELLESNGGGVLSVISILFKILIGFFYSKNKFYIFDESFSQVSSQYRERLSKFLRKFSEQYNFTIILVSQTSDLSNFAHILYEVDYKYNNELKTLYIKNKNINIDSNSEEKLSKYSLNIKNFQSIENTEFIYQGFVVISGPNNCGKSASLRALKSIIFNDFKDKYLRLKSKLCEIIFRKMRENEEAHKIKLIYKSKKIIYEINGSQYLGKNLSADIVKNEVEKIGFRFIDIKKIYKNINKELKEQTEKIAYSSQYDNLFLIGQKSNNIEKVFNFLFNTENIAIAITEIKEEILENQRTLKVLERSKIELEEELKDLIEKINKQELFYETLLIKEYLNFKMEKDKYFNLIQNIKLKLSNIDNYGQKIKFIFDWNKYLLSYFNFMNDKKKLKDLINNKNIELESINTKYSFYKNIHVNFLNLKNNIDILSNYINSINLRKFYKDKINEDLLKLEKVNEYFESIQNKYFNLFNLKKFIEDKNSNLIENKIIKDNIKTLQSKILDIENSKEEKLKTIGVCLCEECCGFGFKKI